MGPLRPDSENVRTTPTARTWLLIFNGLYYAYATVGPWRLCGGMNPSCERWELLQVSMGLSYAPCEHDRLSQQICSTTNYLGSLCRCYSFSSNVRGRRREVTYYAYFVEDIRR